MEENEKIIPEAAIELEDDMPKAKLINVDIEKEMKKILPGLFHVRYRFPCSSGCTRRFKTGTQKNTLYHV